METYSKMKSIKLCRRLVLLLFCIGFSMFGMSAAQAASHSVTLSWTPSMQPDNITAVNWNIYRSTANAGPYAMIASLPVAIDTYVDTAVVSGNEYFYVLTCVDAAGVESGYSVPVDATIPAGDFTGAVDNIAASTIPGGQANYVLTLTGLGGFDADVTLSASGLPPGASASFSPGVVAGGSGSSTLTLAASSATPPGNYLLTITGTGGTVVHSTTVTLQVGSIDFTGNITSITQIVSASTGGSAQYFITLFDLGTKVFGNNVTLSIAGLPAGVTASFLPSGVNPDVSGISMLTLTVSSTTSPGIYSPVITGTGGGVTHSANINFMVAP